MKYDFIIPGALAIFGCGAYLCISPTLPLFGDSGLLRYTRDMLVMGVPFMVGSLAAVAMGAPGNSLDRPPPGAELSLYGRPLTLRQFVCYLLGYLCFLGMVALGGAVIADLMHGPVLAWTTGRAGLRSAAKLLGVLTFGLLLAALVVTIFWALYFLTDIVNRPDGDRRNLD